VVRAECFEWRRSKNAISEGRGGSSMSLFLEAKSSSKVDKAAERHAAAAKVRSRPHWRLIGSLPSTVPALEHARNPSAPRECSRRLTTGYWGRKKTCSIKYTTAGVLTAEPAGVQVCYAKRTEDPDLEFAAVTALWP
jgi:hypothetical protein